MKEKWRGKSKGKMRYMQVYVHMHEKTVEKEKLTQKMKKIKMALRKVGDKQNPKNKQKKTRILTTLNTVVNERPTL